jgi:hypothetical protein
MKNLAADPWTQRAVRAFARVWGPKAESLAEAAYYDSLFDGGEWSARLSANIEQREYEKTLAYVALRFNMTPGYLEHAIEHANHHQLDCLMSMPARIMGCSTPGCSGVYNHEGNCDGFYEVPQRREYAVTQTTLATHTLAAQGETVIKRASELPFPNVLVGFDAFRAHSLDQDFGDEHY